MQRFFHQALFCFLFAISSDYACADYAQFNWAEQAPNIAEIHISEEGVRVRLEVFFADIPVFASLVPDDWFEDIVADRPDLPERGALFGEGVLSIRRDDGRALPLQIERVEPRMRKERSGAQMAGQIDPLSGQLFPSPPEDKRVLYAELFYAFAGERPEAIMLVPPLSATGMPLVAIGMVVFDRAVPVTDFRFLSSPARLRLDWSDPWYSGFDNVQLSRRHKSGIATYLYIEPREVRHETLIRVRDLAAWLELELPEDGLLGVVERQYIGEQAARLLSGRNQLSIDGEPVAPASWHAEALLLELTGFRLIEDEAKIPVDAAFIGVILSFPVAALPETVATVWDMFHERIIEVPAIVTDPAGPFVSSAIRASPEIRWSNHLRSYQELRTSLVTGFAPFLLSVPMLVLLAVGLIFALLAWRCRRRWRLLCAIAAIASLTNALLLREVALIGNPLSPVPPAEARGLFVEMLENLNIAGLEITAEARRREISALVTEEALSEVAAELERALAIRVPGGGLARVRLVRGVALKQVTSIASGHGFSALASWTSEAEAGHWGHYHWRKIYYRALVEMLYVAGVWKLDAITVVETRLLDS